MTTVVFYRGALGLLRIDLANLGVACAASQRDKQVPSRRLPQRAGEASADATFGRQLDDELDHASVILASDIAEAVEEPEGFAVLAKDHRAEPPPRRSKLAPISGLSSGAI